MERKAKHDILDARPCGRIGYIFRLMRKLRGGCQRVNTALMRRKREISSQTFVGPQCFYTSSKIGLIQVFNFCRDRREFERLPVLVPFSAAQLRVLSDCEGNFSGDMAEDLAVYSKIAVVSEMQNAQIDLD